MTPVNVATSPESVHCWFSVMVPSEAMVTEFGPLVKGLPKLLLRMLVLPITIRWAKTHLPRLVHPIGLPLTSLGRPSALQVALSTYLN